MKQPGAFFATQEEVVSVMHIGRQIGFGRLMQLAQKCWRDILDKSGIAGGEFAIGPCVALTVPCGCKQAHKCDWCNGAGWLTPCVREAKLGGSRKANMDNATKIRLIRKAIDDYNAGGMSEVACLLAIAAIVMPQPPLLEETITWAKKCLDDEHSS